MLNLTIRDSQFDFINVSCWNSEQNIFDLNSAIEIGSVLQIKCPQIRLKPSENVDQYR